MLISSFDFYHLLLDVLCFVTNVFFYATCHVGYLFGFQQISVRDSHKLDCLPLGSYDKQTFLLGLDRWRASKNIDVLQLFFYLVRCILSFRDQIFHVFLAKSNMFWSSSRISRSVFPLFRLFFDRILT